MEKLTLCFKLKQQPLSTALKKVNSLSRCDVPCLNNSGKCTAKAESHIESVLPGDPHGSPGHRGGGVPLSLTPPSPSFHA